MKDNKHPHHDLIAEWIEDTSKILQECCYCGKAESWVECHVESVIKDTTGEIKFRIKPREFIKGHWYPCYYEGREFVCKFDGETLIEPINKGYQAILVAWDAYSCCGLKVGKSLGEIKFNE